MTVYQGLFPIYYPCSENKGDDELYRYCKADLRLCFRIDENPVSS